jgi:uncharacterized heparinase superfamily protein
LNLLRTLRTVRYLKPIQVSDRLLRRYRHVPARWSPAGNHELLVRRPQVPARARARRSDGETFRFLNLSRRLAGEGRWQPGDVPRLWGYQLHCFRWLWDVAPRLGLELVRDWIAANPPGSVPGWEPYPLSIRIREWMEWLLAHPEVPASEQARITASLAHQNHALEGQIEFHLLGNHLLENAITLCWAGLGLEGPSAAAWLRRGLQILESQAAEQVLADGTHDERSPMYQSLLAEALLRLEGVAADSSHTLAAPVRAVASKAGRALVESLGRLVHPDGEIALLNDSALGEAPQLASLLERFSPGVQGESSSLDRARAPWHLPGAGYLGWSDGSTYLILDAGPLGPDHQPGHGHADVLSFELSHHGRRLVTDTGVLTYDPGPARAWDRGTGAHNTVQVDGLDQAELWAAFRCGRRPRPIEAAVSDGNGAAVLVGAYHAAAPPFNLIRHRRALSVSGVHTGPPRLLFADRIESRGAHTAVIRLHLAPDVSARRDAVTWLLVDGAAVRARLLGDGFVWNETRSPYHPEMGKEIERVSLFSEVRFVDRLDLAWSLELS